MIAAPDVVARTVDPSDFLEFATGRLHARFVKSAGDLDDRLRHLDGDPDPDGRYRVNELCCQADTWRAAVVGLMDRADAVLMDLRDFSKKRAGCAFELQVLGQRLDTRRLVLTVDDTTDREFLAANLGARALRRGSSSCQRGASACETSTACSKKLPRRLTVVVRCKPDD